MMVGDTVSAEYKGKTYYFMNPKHREIFLENPSRFLKWELGVNEMEDSVVPDEPSPPDERMDEAFGEEYQFYRQRVPIFHPFPQRRSE